jgi:hypothetical protein
MKTDWRTSLRLFITGDTHGEWGKLVMFKRRMKDTLTLDDYLIICGDAGYIWDTIKRDNKLIAAALGDFPCMVLWIDGNHENFNLLEKYPVMNWKGGKVHVTGIRFYHLMRGEVFDFNGVKIFTCGGALSIDRGPINGVFGNWWPQEQPDAQEQQNALSNLAKHDFKVDYVITHEAPSSMYSKMLGIRPISELDSEFRAFLSKIERLTEFKHWYFGHHHKDLTYGDYTCLYDSIIELT